MEDSPLLPDGQVISFQQVLEIYCDYNRGLRLRQAGLVRHPEVERGFFKVESDGLAPQRDSSSMKQARTELGKPSLVPIVVPRVSFEGEKLSFELFKPERPYPALAQQGGFFGTVKADLSYFYSDEEPDKDGETFFILPEGTVIVPCPPLEDFDEAEARALKLREHDRNLLFLWEEKINSSSLCWEIRIPSSTVAIEVPVLSSSQLKAMIERKRLAEERAQERERQREADEHAASAQGNGSGGTTSEFGSGQKFLFPT